ncbi:MAG: phytoene desaturase [Sphingobacteriales bacterium]|nr:phytoene desaturase [Sphingobacteriales bacterium]
MKQKDLKVAVVGAGIGGLATALRLRHLGYQVDVFESSDSFGGKIKELRRDGFRFDMGPSLFTLPQLVKEIFDLYHVDFDKAFPYYALDVVCKYFYEDGLQLSVSSNPSKFAEDAEKLTFESRQRILKFLRKSEYLYNLTSTPFIFNKLFSFSNIFSWPFLKALLNAYRLNSFNSMHEYNKGYFQDKHLVQLFDRYATYNGSNPYQAPATLNVIAHLENNIGAYFPSNGMFQIPVSLYKLACENGINFYFNTKVDAINIKKKKVKSIVVKGEELNYDVVVSDVDIKTLYKKIIRGATLPKRIEKHELSTSALIFYWGISTVFPVLDVHNILFSQGYKEEFENLFQLKNIYHDPTVYIFISSKIVKTDAPEGCENWYVMINAPENIGQNWDQIIQTARKNITEKINRVLKTDIENYILFEERLDPLQIEERTSSWHGSLYGMSSNSVGSAFMRHPNYFSKIKNLCFTGGSVHPGGGIPLCLSSAKIIANHLSKTIIR